MIELSQHAWGVSPAQDCVLAHICGLAPSVCMKRQLMVLQAYFDDSSQEDGFYILGGYVAPAETWIEFAKDWENMLPVSLGTLQSDGRRRFKMSEMMYSTNDFDYSLKQIEPFFRIIEKHDPLPVASILHVKGIKNAAKRVKNVYFEYERVASVDFGPLMNPYMLNFRLLVEMFHQRDEIWNRISPNGEKVDFIFDNQSEKRFILDAWDDFVALRPEHIRTRFGATPRFEDDEEFLPLQAADFWAWSNRWWAENDNFRAIAEADFGVWKASKEGKPKLTLFMYEDDIARFFAAVAKKNAPKGAVTFLDRNPV